MMTRSTTSILISLLFCRCGGVSTQTLFSFRENSSYSLFISLKIRKHLSTATKHICRQVNFRLEIEVGSNWNKLNIIEKNWCSNVDSISCLNIFLSQIWAFLMNCITCLFFILRVEKKTSRVKSWEFQIIDFLKIRCFSPTYFFLLFKNTLHTPQIFFSGKVLVTLKVEDFNDNKM